MSAGILIVDDDRDLSSMLAEFLGHEGFQVATIEEGGGALDRSRSALSISSSSMSCCRAAAVSTYCVKSAKENHAYRY